jgi:hypothetical protein
MYFNLKGFLRFTGRWAFQFLQTGFKWAGRRVAVFVAFLLLYPLLEIVVWLGLWLDELLFRSYRRVSVDASVFVVGNPRSGTTFLHRLLAKDGDRFTTMALWEIIFAPSITTRKFVRALSNLDRWLGSPAHRYMAAVERGWWKKNVMHRVSLRMPEEDDYVLLHRWSALTAGLSAGLLDEAMPYTYFDTALSKVDRTRTMAFYKACVKRHLRAYRDEGGKQYLAKNPALCPKLVTLLEHFPDARIIYLVRSPLEMIPSYTSMMDFTWETLGIPVDGDGLHRYVLEMAQHWYSYPLEQLNKVPPHQYIVVKYDDMVADPERTVTEIYQHFGFEMTPAFARVLHEEAERARAFQSRHDYSLEEVGLERQEILDRCDDIFERFGFDRQAELGHHSP